MKHKTHFRRIVIAGLLVWIPITVTWLVIKFVFDLLDNTLALLPAGYQPEKLFGFHLPGFGVILAIVVVLATGVIVSNVLGKQLVHFGERIMLRIPLVNTIYHAVKQVVHTLFTSGGQSFRKVFLVEYPRKGLWSLAFQTAVGASQATTAIGEDVITIFIPTTPNPTSGFLLMVPRESAIEVDMSVDAALKMVISLGVVQPIATPNKTGELT